MKFIFYLEKRTILKKLLIPLLTIPLLLMGCGSKTSTDTAKAEASQNSRSSMLKVNKSSTEKIGNDSSVTTQIVTDKETHLQFIRTISHTITYGGHDTVSITLTPRQ